MSVLTKLVSLDLSGMPLTGPIPASWSALTSLTSLNLDGTLVSGPLPATLPSSLLDLSLSGAGLTGPLSGVVANWTSLVGLTSLDLSNNTLTGESATHPSGAGVGQWPLRLRACVHTGVRGCHEWLLLHTVPFRSSV